MADSAFRRIAATVFVLLLTVPAYASEAFGWSADPGGVLDGVTGFLIWVIPFLVLGLLVGRWWALLIVFIPVVLVLPLGIDSGDHDHALVTGETLIGAVIGAPFAAAGLILLPARARVSHRPPAGVAS